MYILNEWGGAISGPIETVAITGTIVVSNRLKSISAGGSCLGVVSTGTIRCARV